MNRNPVDRSLLPLAAVLLWLAAPSVPASEHGLVIHEWGTFTSLQDEAGRAIGGLNTDDEPVPEFVHDIAKSLLIKPTQAPPVFFQGAPRCHPDVTMRLETPVLYVHAGPGAPSRLRVQVSFRGGWLTQFYPNATVTAPGIDAANGRFGELNPRVTGSLAWNNLSVSSAGAGPATQEHVWLAPRQVDASFLKTERGEMEKYLFYRGVGRLEAPLAFARNASREKFVIARNGGVAPDIRQLWLADIRADGQAAFRQVELGEAARYVPLAGTSATFAPGEYRETAVGELRAELKAAAVGAGLFADEAEALLATWELSYFKSAGLRTFFLVPPAWTQAVLPLTVEGASSIVRVMIGRIELVTPAQRQLLHRIAEGPAPEPWSDLRQPTDALTWQAGKNREFSELLSGKRTFAQIGVQLPPVYQAYLDLGRFRNALVLHEQKHNPSRGIGEFIRKLGLEGCRP